MSYPGHSFGRVFIVSWDAVGVFYSPSRLGHRALIVGVLAFCKVLSVFTTVPADWATGHSLGEFYPSTEVQLVYSTAPAVWAIEFRKLRTLYVYIYIFRVVFFFLFLFVCYWFGLFFFFCFFFVQGYIKSFIPIEFKKMFITLWPVDETLTDTTNLPDQNRPLSNGNEEVLHTPRISRIEVSQWDAA